MNNEDMSELFNKFSTMINEGNIPDDMKNILSSLSSNGSSNSSKGFENSNSNVSSNDTNSHNINSKDDNSSNSSSFDNSSIDFETILKMKNIMEKMKQNNNDPRANLLLSLKPYLKESRKEKVDQYIKLFNMSKVIDVFDDFRGWHT